MRQGPAAIRAGRRRQTRRLLGLGGAVIAVATTVPAAGASAAGTPGAIPGNPLQIQIDGTGQLQVHLQGFSSPEFDPATLEPGHTPALILWFWSGWWSPCQPTGLPTPVSGPTAPTGTGTVADPFTMSAVFDCNAAGPIPTLRIVETITYVNGDANLVAKYAITNNQTTSPLFFRATVYGQVDLGGAGQGAGFHDAAGSLGPGSPEDVGAFNDATGSQATLSQLASSPWSSYMEGSAADVLRLSGRADMTTLGPGLNDAIAAFTTTPSVAAQDNRYTTSGLPAGATDTFAVDWSFIDYAGLSLAPVSDTKQVGGTETMLATSLDHGQPAAGVAIRYAVAGANPTSGVVTAGANGTAAISWTGMHAGTDTLTAFTDVAGTGTFDPSQDTEQTSTVSWNVPPPAPPTPPVNAGTPAISGVAAVGQQLTCSTGSWSGSTPQAYLYTWLRDGTAIGAPSSAGTYAVVAADAGHALTCLVTATNAAASTTARSAAVAVAAPLQIQVAVTAPRLASLIAHGLTVHESCSAACRATATVSVTYGQARLLGLAHGGVLGSASARLGQAGSLTLKATLAAAARRALQRTRRSKVTIILVAAATDSAGHAAAPFKKTLTVKR